MHYLKTLICLGLAAGCVRPATDLSFTDLTVGASTGLQQYYEWVKADEAALADQFGARFPNRVCLAAVLLEAKLAVGATRSAGGSVPIAGPLPGLSTLFGYSVTATEDDVGVIVAPMEAIYSADAPKNETEAAKAEKIFKAFPASIETLREGLNTWSKTDDGLRLPFGVDQAAYAAASDLAAEMWTLREGLHQMVLNSPSEVVLGPGPLTVDHEYRVVKTEGGSATITLAGKSAGSASAGRTTSGYNRLTILFARNRSPDQMTCDDASIPADFLAKHKQGASQIR